VIAVKDSVVLNSLELLDHARERSESANSFQEYLIAWFINHSNDSEFQNILEKNNISGSILGEIKKIQAVMELSSQSNFYCFKD
jgi:hypothetical protein